VPTWQDDVAAPGYVPWDEARDGPRLVVDTTDTARTLDAALGYVQQVTETGHT
jgi:hypothetical protein